MHSNRFFFPNLLAYSEPGESRHKMILLKSKLLIKRFRDDLSIGKG